MLFLPRLLFSFRTELFYNRRAAVIKRFFFVRGKNREKTKITEKSTRAYNGTLIGRIIVRRTTGTRAREPVFLVRESMTDVILFSAHTHSAPIRHCWPIIVPPPARRSSAHDALPPPPLIFITPHREQ